MSKRYGTPNDVPVANGSASQLPRDVITPISVRPEGNSSRLLTVHQVADLLQVPVSWVYGRTRKRSLERLPGYRLGKYWRFDRDEVLAWVARHKATREAA